MRATITKIDGMASVYKEPSISTSIKENPFKANVELEGKGKGKKGEVVLRPDFGAIHDVVGPRHSRGGVEAFIPEGSFVFSDFEELSFNEQDHKLFELKEGGSTKASKNTPAEVLRRNVDVKHYNKMSDTLMNKDKDKISKNTAARMLTKYAEKLGQISYIQEAKKGFPDGIPEISEGTAPVYDGDLKDDIMQQKQFMKRGGLVFMQEAGTKGLSRASNIPPADPITPATKPVDPGFKFPTPAWWPKPKYPTSSECPPGHKFNYVTAKCEPIPVKSEKDLSIDPNTVSGLGKVDPIQWQFNPYQKLSLSNMALNMASINRELPMRSQISSPLVELEKVNNQANFNRLQNEMTSAYRANRIMNPYLAGSNNAQVYGRGLDAFNEATANAINSNIQITNQQNLMNNQIQRQDLQSNIGADQQYWQQSAVGRQNYDNARSFARNRFMEGFNSMVQQNQSLAYNIAALGPNSPFGYDFKTGDYFLTGKGNVMGAPSTQSQEDYIKMVKQLRGQGIPDSLISTILKTSAFSKLQPNKKGGTFNPFR